MKKIFILLSIMLIACTSLLAQREETLFNRAGGIRLTGLWGGSTNGMADFKEDFNFTNGGFFVFELNDDFLIGWAGYGSDITSDGRTIDIGGNDLLLGYTMNSDNIIHPAFYLQTGSSKLEVENVGTDRVFVVQPSIGAEVNIARFFRLGVDAGYRFFNDTELPGFSDKDFSGPIIGLRLKFGWSW
jgi:hypothetical protein